MASIKMEPLDTGLPFGCRIRGVSASNVADETVRTTVRQAFERDGMIVFADMEPSDELQMAVSSIFGPPAGIRVQQ